MSPSVCQIPLQVANIIVRVYLFEHNIFIFLTVNHIMYMFDISSGMVIDKVKAYGFNCYRRQRHRAGHVVIKSEKQPLFY